MKILSLNCFGVPAVSPRPKERMKLIAEHILKLQPDLVFLQEVFLSSHKKILAEVLGPHYPAAYLPGNGIFRTGGGLCFFSKEPIVEKAFTPYSRSGSWTDMTWTDKLAGKGFMKVKISGGRAWNFFHTHLTCNYKNDFSAGCRQAKLILAQLEELARAVRAVPPDEPVLVVGDLNVPSGSELFTGFLKSAGVMDLAGSDQPSMQENCYAIPLSFADAAACFKVDHILCRSGSGIRCEWEYVFKNSTNVFSDHLGILLDLAEQNDKPGTATGRPLPESGLPASA